jgi:hypothetical protein
MLLEASFDGPVRVDYFALHRAFERPAYVESAPPADPAMTPTLLAAPRWCAEAEKRLAWVLSLPENWDGTGARRVGGEAVRRAWSFLSSIMPTEAPAPDIGPTKDGQLQLEWHRRSADLEIRMRPTGEFEVAFEDLDQPEQSWDDVVTVEIERVTDALRQISEHA